MKYIIWILVVLAVGGYFGSSYLEGNARREAKKIGSERVEQAIKSSVAQAVSRAGAIHDWEQRLSKGDNYWFGPILTVDLERLWLQNQPILFVGVIKDIATQDQTHYKLLVGRSPFGNYEYMFDTEMQLSLLSRKEQIDSFIKRYPDLFKDYGFNSGVAVVAHINSIRTIYVPGEEGDRESIKIGDGELVDIIFTGDVTF